MRTIPLWIAIIIAVFALRTSIYGGSSAAHMLPPAEVARDFGYQGTLESRDITELNKGANVQIIWSGNFTSPDSTFAPTTITVAAGHSILTPVLSQGLEENADRELKLLGGQVAPPAVRRITIRGGAKGFAFMAGVGPGGTGYSAVVTSPDGATDVAVAINLSSATPLRMTGRTQSYFSRISDGQNGALGLLMASIPEVYAAVGSRLGSTATPSPSVSVDTAKPASPPPMTTLPRQADVQPSLSPSPAGADQGARSIFYRCVIAISVVAAFVTSAFVRFRKRP